VKVAQHGPLVSTILLRGISVPAMRSPRRWPVDLTVSMRTAAMVSAMIVRDVVAVELPGGEFHALQPGPRFIA